MDLPDFFSYIALPMVSPHTHAKKNCNAQGTTIMILLVDIQVRQRDVRYLSVVSYLQANRTS